MTKSVLVNKLKKFSYAIKILNKNIKIMQLTKIIINKYSIKLKKCSIFGWIQIADDLNYILMICYSGFYVLKCFNSEQLF
jgi:hypothetical protein